MSKIVSPQGLSCDDKLLTRRNKIIITRTIWTTPKLTGTVYKLDIGVWVHVLVVSCSCSCVPSNTPMKPVARAEPRPVRCTRGLQFQSLQLLHPSTFTPRENSASTTRPTRPSPAISCWAIDADNEVGENETPFQATEGDEYAARRIGGHW